MVDRAQTSPAIRSEKVTPAAAVTSAVRYKPPTADLDLQHLLAAQGGRREQPGTSEVVVCTSASGFAKSINPCAPDLDLKHLLAAQATSVRQGEGH